MTQENDLLFVDSHCHIHDTEFFPDNQEKAYAESRAAGVAMICVGTDLRSSREVIEFCHTHEGCFAVVGIHPHEAKSNKASDIRKIVEKNRDMIVGIGEIGLDYHYDHSPREVQRQRLREQLEIARDFDLPVSFHVREAFDDFWPIFDEFSETRGVLHSFTDNDANAKKGLERGLYIGVNGISTFTKDPEQQYVYATIPTERLLIETDAPYLTPVPFRGKMNIPAYVGRVAEHLAMQRNVSPDVIMRATTTNAKELFGISL